MPNLLDDNHKSHLRRHKFCDCPQVNLTQKGLLWSLRFRLRGFRVVVLLFVDTEPWESLLKGETELGVRDGEHHGVVDGGGLCDEAGQGGDKGSHLLLISKQSLEKE